MRQRAIDASESRAVRRLLTSALLFGVVCVLVYGSSDCPAANANAAAADNLIVVTTDLHGKPEYCAFATRVTQDMTRIPVGGPVGNLCGPKGLTIVAKTAAYQHKIASQKLGCLFRHEGLLRLLDTVGLWHARPKA